MARDDTRRFEAPGIAGVTLISCAAMAPASAIDIMSAAVGNRAASAINGMSMTISGAGLGC
jgi:hypothetical protein